MHMETVRERSANDLAYLYNNIKFMDCPMGHYRKPRVTSEEMEEMCP